MELLRIVEIPQGTYTGMSYSVTNLKVRAWDPGANRFVDFVSSGALNGSGTLSPAIVLGSSAAILNVDLDLENTVSFDTANNLIVTPNFKLTASPIPSADAQLPETGLAENLVGVVTAVSGTNFSMQIHGAITVNITTDNNTTGPVASVANNAIVSVDAVSQADGSLLAKRIDSVETGAVVLVQGSVIGMPGSRYGEDTATLHVEGVWAPGSALAPAIGDDLTLTGLSEAAYTVDPELLDASYQSMSFDNAHFGVGQRVQALVTAGTTSVTTLKMRLLETSATGTVQDYTGGSSFTLRVDSDSAIQNVTSLMPQTYLTTWLQPRTTFQGFPAGSPMQNGMRVRVRGPAFWFWLLGYTPGGTTVIPTRIDYLPQPLG
jgi:hypothetical protein